MGTASGWSRNEGRMKFERIDRHVTNEVYAVWFLDFTKRFYNNEFYYIWLSQLLFSYTTLVMTQSKSLKVDPSNF